MNQEQKGELIGQLCAYEEKIKSIGDEIFALSCKSEKLVDNLCKVSNEEYLNLINDVQYIIGKMKGLLR
jgi:hypothetical protein